MAQGQYRWSSKGKEITEAVRNKNASIKKFQDLKSVQVAVSSCFNAALELCNILVDHDKLTAKDYWAQHEKLYTEMLTRFTDAQEEAKMAYETYGLIKPVKNATKKVTKGRVGKEMADDEAINIALEQTEGSDELLPKGIDDFGDAVEQK